MGMRKPSANKPPGPEPERLKVEGDWEEAVKVALKKKPQQGKETKAQKGERT